MEGRLEKRSYQITAHIIGPGSKITIPEKTPDNVTPDDDSWQLIFVRQNNNETKRLRYSYLFIIDGNKSLPWIAGEFFLLVSKSDEISIRGCSFLYFCFDVTQTMKEMLGFHTKVTKKINRVLKINRMQFSII